MGMACSLEISIRHGPFGLVGRGCRTEGNRKLGLSCISRLKEQKFHIMLILWPAAHTALSPKFVENYSLCALGIRPLITPPHYANFFDLRLQPFHRVLWESTGFSIFFKLLLTVPILFKYARDRFLNTYLFY